VDDVEGGRGDDDDEGPQLDGDETAMVEVTVLSKCQSWACSRSAKNSAFWYW
jgi:hypothetical protein